MNRLLREGCLPNYHGKVWLDCTVVGSEQQLALQVLIQGIEGLTLESHPELPDVSRQIAQLDDIVSVSFRHRSGVPEPLVGELYSTIEVDELPMWLPAGSFFQTNLTMLSRVLARLRAELATSGAQRVADVYGGVGSFALNLAAQLGEMHLIELDPFAVEAARRTASDRRLANMSFISRHAERALPELPALDAVIVDPPRSGLGTTVTDAIAANKAPLVLYVSCAPASLARDLAELLAAGYRICSLEAFDFYPQTYHVESLTVLRR
jgi:23S rRNA (uracil1939-C5)-methyltransferase